MSGPESLLDFSQPLNIQLLDQAVSAFFEGNAAVQPILVQWQDHPEAWTRVDQILEQSQNVQSKIIACNVLEQCVKFRWQVLADAHKQGIRKFVIDLIIKLSSDKDSLKANKLLLSKLNMVLVRVVKWEWPHNWPGFIPELVHSSKTSEALCANNMDILLLLSEEVFDYSAGQLTQAKMKEMKTNLNQEFKLIFQLCEYILENSKDQTLLTTTLSCLLRFLHWIPVVYIFQTKLIETLAVTFLPVNVFQNVTLQCLGEIGGLDTPGQHQEQYLALFDAVMRHVAVLLTPEVSVHDIYSEGDEGVEQFVRHLTIFITSFLRHHLTLLENTSDETRACLIVSLGFLLRLSRVDDDVIFKICLECWALLVEDLYNTQRKQPAAQPQALMLAAAQALPTQQQPLCPRVMLYKETLSQLRLVMIAKMAKPEEVLVVEDENGEIVREAMKDTAAIILYKNMRTALVYLANLDVEDTQNIMIMKLEHQVDGSEWSWHNLNTLCWAIGSIASALNENQEKSFLVRVIKDLLGLCEIMRGKQHKAVIAANIMYVVGQYPRFLRLHWKFLKTVVNKLFEFMHERHPGVQDMSCDTFVKIAKKCRRKLVGANRQYGDPDARPFVEEIITNLPETIADLEPGQMHTFYQAVAEIIQAETVPEQQQKLVFGLMAGPNDTWSRIIAEATSNLEVLSDPKTVKAVVWILTTNLRVAASLGPSGGYECQMQRIFVEMLGLYKMYSTFISNKVQECGAGVTKTAVIRSMRSVKKCVLKLLQTFLASCQPSQHEKIITDYLPAMIDPILDDYTRNVPDARDAEVLALFSEVVNQLAAPHPVPMTPHISRIFEATFGCTLQMITKNFEDYPDVRVNFFKLLRAVNQHAFEALLPPRLAPQQFQLVMDSVVWAFKHLERNIAESGLYILLELLNNVQRSDIANQFYTTYFNSLLADLLSVMTDTFHVPGFRLHSTILAELFRILEGGAITVPLWEQAPTPAGQAPQQFANNHAYVRHCVTTLICSSFKHLAPGSVELFVDGLFSLNTDLPNFKNHLRDFLIQQKEFAVDDNSQVQVRADFDASEQAHIQQQQQLAQQQQQAQQDM